MTRDYKPTQSKPRSPGKGSTFFTGFLIGLILGIGVSVAVAIFVKGGESPFVARDAATPRPDAAPKADVAAGASKPTTAEPKTPAKPRFDFYTILPGSESPVTEEEIKQSKSTQQQAAPAVVSENYYLQVGAYQTEQEADNMKAKLALLGQEAVVQTANLPDKGVWHRVRVGPFTEIDQISKARGELTKNGFTADLIKIHSNVPDQ